MSIWGDTAKDVAEGALRSNNECGALNAHGDLSVEFLLNVSAIGLGDRFIRIREEQEREIVFLGKLGVRIWRIRADAAERGGYFEQRCVEIAKRAGLASAAGGVVFGIEVEDERMAVGKERAEGVSLLKLIESCEVWGGCVKSDRGWGGRRGRFHGRSRLWSRLLADHFSVKFSDGKSEEDKDGDGGGDRGGKTATRA